MLYDGRKLGWMAAVAVCAAGWIGAAASAEDKAVNTSRVLIVYFSHSGNTHGIAERLQKKTGAAVHRIVPKKAYPEEYQAVLAQARKEINESFKPELAGDLPTLDDIDLVLIGGPVWAGTLSPPLASFLAQVDLKGKTVAPFCTYGGGMRDYFKHVKAAVSKEATVLDGLGLGREQLKKAEEYIDKAVSDWVAKLPKPKAE